MREEYPVALVIPTVDLSEVGLEVGNDRIVLVGSIAIRCDAVKVELRNGNNWRIYSQLVNLNASCKLRFQNIRLVCRQQCQTSLGTMGSELRTQEQD